jgi:tetratricopeptide (TPR) repeat protein
MRAFRLSRRAAARMLPVSAATVATLSLSAVALAQPGGVGPSCELDGNSPKELFVANQAYQKAAQQTDPAARQIALKEVMKQLTNKADKWKSKNPMGHAMLTGQTLALWIADQQTPLVTTRGAIGATDAPETPINLIEATDEAFKSIVAASPACAGDVATLRQNEGWLAMTRKALDMSSGDADSANAYAQHSLTLLPENNPYPYQVLGIVAQRQGDVDKAVASWDKAVEASGTDSSYADIRQSSLFYIGLYSLEQSRTLTGAEQTARLNKAVSAMDSYLKDFGTAQDAPTVMQGMGEAYMTLGDTAKVASIYAPMLATPGEFSDYALTMGGVLATQAEKTADAITLFESAVNKNPNQRDALRNLAASYYTDKQYEKMVKPLQHLVSIDPNNVDAWSMFAFGAQGRMQAATAAPEKKQWTDSLVYYAGKADSLPVKLSIDEFQRNAESVAFTVSLEGNTDKPKANTLSVEFLDASGNVVATASEEVAPLPRGERKVIRLEAQGSGIVAYRYKPLS